MCALYISKELTSNPKKLIISWKDIVLGECDWVLLSDVVEKLLQANEVLVEADKAN